MKTQRIFWVSLDRRAPAKPAEGARCNGCGACCAAQPCPLGMLASRSRHGRCRMLGWDEQALVYVCGLVAGPRAWPRWARRLALRWIGSGIGCDFAAEVEEAAGAGWGRSEDGAG